MRNATKIVMILDRSGSMASVKDAMQEVLNGFIAAQKEQPGECTFSLIKFDNEYERSIVSADLKHVGKIELEPRGSTALLDAIGQTIDDVGTELSAMQEHLRPNKVLFVIITDGFENASYRYVTTAAFGQPQQAKSKRVFDMITHQRDNYNWTFIFLGADQDAIASAAGLGIAAGSSLNYGNNSRDIKGMGAKMSRGIAAFRMSDTPTAGLVAVNQVLSENSNKVTEKDTEDWDNMVKNKVDNQSPTATNTVTSSK